MTQLHEIKTARQVPGELQRRWFTSTAMDLFIWCDAAGTPVGFQLAYDKGLSERALTWEPELGFVHAGVDDGEGRDGRYKATPLLVVDGEPDIERIVGLVHEVGPDLPSDLKSWLLAKMREFPLANPITRHPSTP